MIFFSTKCVFVCMKSTITKIFSRVALLSFLLLGLGCNPCDIQNGDGAVPDYIFYHTNINSNLIFRYDFENFLIKEVVEDFKLGESYNKDKSLYYNSDSIFLLETYTLNSSLIYENILDLEVKNCILNNNGDVFIIKTKDNQLFKSDLSNNLEFLDNNLLNNKIELHLERVYYWQNDNLLKLKAINIINSMQYNIEIDLDLENISNLSINSESVAFSNYNDNSSKIYFLSSNLNIIDSTLELNKPKIKPIFIENILFYYDNKSIYDKDFNVIYTSNEFDKIENLYFNKKLSLIFLYLKDNLTDEQSIYYFKKEKSIDINFNNINLLINNAVRVD